MWIQVDGKMVTAEDYIELVHFTNGEIGKIK
jgi:hypothetical protein